MIISRRDEGMAMACRGLTGDLVIFSSMFRGGWETVLYCVLMERIVRGNNGGRKRVKERENNRMRRRDGGNYFYKNMKRTGKRRKEQHRQWAMNQGWERREQSEFIAIPLFCCSVFFLLTQWTWREQAAFFYRSHATSQWSMDAGPLQTYTVEHALCGSAKRDHLGERGSIPLSLLL